MTAASSQSPALAIIGGSGIQSLDGLSEVKSHAVTTPFGSPSAAIIEGTMEGQRLLFLPRHGEGHIIPPSELNFRANIAALKMLGAEWVISLSAVGSFKENLAPGTFVIVDQFIDRTHSRLSSFFGTGLVAHVAIAEPVCTALGDRLEFVLRRLEAPHHRGGTYLAIEGPQFSTRAESELYRGWNADVIGMTNMPEAKLAREAELCYATLGMVTDYDCWHNDHASVTVEAIIGVLRENAAVARNLVRNMAPLASGLIRPCPHGCDRALDHAIITPPLARDPKMIEKLDCIARRVLRTDLLP